MRYLIPFFLCLAFACSEKKQDPVTSITVSGIQIDSLRRENLKTPIDSSIILGFRFGMSKQEYDYNYSRLIRVDTLHKFSKTEYSYWIKSKYSKVSMDGVLIPSFDKGELVQLKMLTYESEKGMGSLMLRDYLNSRYGMQYLSARSLSSIWIKGGLEIDLKREQVQTDPNLPATAHDIITFRPTQLALLGHL